MENDLGIRIKDIRRTLGLTMEEFGKKFNPPASKGVVSNWENGYNNPNNARLQKISELGGISVNELIYGDDREYILPIVNNISKKYYDIDISNNPDFGHEIINQLSSYSFNDTETSLYSNNKKIFDLMLLTPSVWGPEMVIHFISTKIFQLEKELDSSFEKEKNNLDPRVLPYTESTIEDIKKILNNAKTSIENIELQNEYINLVIELDKERQEEINNQMATKFYDFKE